MSDRDRGPDARREHDAVHEWDAAYVLGGLSADERAQFERHLCGCDTCTASVADLAGLPAVLRLLPADQAVAIAEEAPVASPAAVASSAAAAGRRASAPAERDEPVLDAASRRPDRADRADRADRDDRARRGDRSRRAGRDGRPGSRGPGRLRTAARSRVLVGAAAALAAVLLVGGGYVVGTASGRGDVPTAAVTTPAPAVPVAMTSLVGGAVTADLSVTPTPWGTRFDWECAYAADLEGTGIYDLVVEEVDGTRTVVATWDSAPGGASGLAASSRLPLDRLRSVEITAADSTTVLTRTTL